MAIDDDVFRAILALDSYNRGYDAEVDISALGGSTTQLGTATLGDQKGDAEAQAASFFAQSYTYNGETIISYRGTDALLDVVTGAGLGLGFPEGGQPGLALSFFRHISNNTSNPISLTGHSLGGGLAGFVASIEGKQDDDSTAQGKRASRPAGEGRDGGRRWQAIGARGASTEPSTRITKTNGAH